MVMTQFAPIFHQNIFKEKKTAAVQLQCLKLNDIQEFYHITIVCVLMLFSEFDHSLWIQL